MSKKYQIVVIGGGISGIYLSHLLQKKLGNVKNIALFEKSYRMGGRVKSETVDAGDSAGAVVIEAGAGRLMPNHRRLIQLIKKFGLQGEMMEKVPTKDAKLSALVEKVRKFGTLGTNRDLARSLTYLELMNMCLTQEEVEYYKSHYGFGDEIHYLQAEHAIQQFEHDLRHDQKFYLLKCGLETIVHRLEEENKKNKIPMYTHHLLQEVEFVPRDKKYPYRLHFEVFNTFQKVIVHAREIVFCIPPHFLKEITFSFPREEMKDNDPTNPTNAVDRLCNMVHEGTLIRIYAKYGNDFKSIQKSRVEGGLLRNIIPVGNNSGIVQYYSDYNQAKELENYRLTGEKVLKDVIARELQIRSIPDPEWIKIYYWNHGVHHWKPNVNIKSAVPEIQWNPFGAKHNIRIVGEAFCRNQGWIEGALENVDEFYKEWIKRRKSKIRNGTIRRRGECTMRDVEKHNKPGDAWTVIHGKVYDITKFIKKHPGGMIIMNVAGRDGTKYFDYIQHPEYVRNVMEKYFRGYLKK